MKKIFSFKKQTADGIGSAVGIVLGMSIFSLLKNGGALHGGSLQDSGIMFIILMSCLLVCIYIIRRLNKEAR